MQFHIMNNAIDSLRFGLVHYEKFLKNIDDIGLEIDEHFSELKFSTIAIHNAIELFTKQILYDVNELLIFTVDVSDKFIASLLHEKYVKGNRDSHMDYWIAGKVDDTTYKTIDYKKSIEILKAIFKEELSYRDYEVLESLGRIRNAITHLGYWDDFKWYKILIAINDSLKLVRSFYSKIIKKHDRYFEGDILEEIDKLLILAEEELEETWWASWETYVDGIYEYFETVFAEMVDTIELETDDYRHSLKKVSFERAGKKIDLIVKLIPRCDAIIFTRDDVILSAINISMIRVDKKLDIVSDTIKFYYFKNKTIYNNDLFFEWKNMKRCDGQVHLLKQLEKSYE